NDLFPKLDGMFAVAIWDSQRRCLVVARDRVGEKPLYIGRAGDGWAIASELKALLLHPRLDRAIDPAAVEQYLAFDYVVGPRTILRNVQKLRAGHVGTISVDGFVSVPYWTLRFESSGTSLPTAIERLDQILDESVRRRMLADVPLGLFLSGGLDSSTVGYYMRRHSKSVKAFTIGFEVPAFDETDQASVVARHLGLDHEIEVLSEEAVLNLIPQLTAILDEPMADPSIIPTYLLSLFARRSVTVALGGDGSDELLMGYRTYQALKIAGGLDVLPFGARSVLAAIARRLPDRTGSTYGKARRLMAGMDVPAEARLLHRLGSFGTAARSMINPVLRAELGQAVEIDPLEEIRSSTIGGRDWADRTIATYVRGYLQEDILVKVDRASMAASLEVRAPFLAPALIDYLGTVSSTMKLAGFERKHLLRRLMRGRIPDVIIDRPKQGFGAPLDSWFRASLAGFAADVLDPERVEASGLLDAHRASILLAEHRKGNADHGNRLWSAIGLQLWHEHWMTSRPLDDA
ncbi:MAG: asparagine synthase (glutamine-hydrolyzing), partial [Chloroflexota bacterium]